MVKLKVHRWRGKKKCLCPFDISYFYCALFFFTFSRRFSLFTLWLGFQMTKKVAGAGCWDFPVNKSCLNSVLFPHGNSAAAEPLIVMYYRLFLVFPWCYYVAAADLILTKLVGTAGRWRCPTLHWSTMKKNWQGKNHRGTTIVRQQVCRLDAEGSTSRWLLNPLHGCA